MSVHSSGVAATALVQIGAWTNRTLVLPLAILFPTSRCNSRCVSCDWWKSGGETDLSVDEIGTLADELKSLGTRVVLFSGGEPLLRPDVFAAAEQCIRRGLTLHLHTSGLHLERAAVEVARYFSRVIVSLDAPTESLYQQIRGVAALSAVERGVARLRRLAPGTPVTARTTLHRLNFREVPALIDHAKAMGLDGISFLATDISTSAFGRHEPDAARRSDLALTAADVAEFDDVLESTIADHADDFASGFVLESAEKLRRLPRYFAALSGDGAFPSVSCNAPQVSVVIEADGTVRPCFFHRSIGSIRQQSLTAIVREHLPEFRVEWGGGDNPTCTRCVCSLKTTWRSAPWH
ncbi:MAG: radical SAM protein [Vicinamibacterales bacterium]